MITLGAKEAEQAKNDGIAAAAAARTKLLAQAQQYARIHSTINGSVTADDVAIELEKRHIDSTELGNAAGALFRGKGWQFVGYTKSVRVSRHANKIGIWTYKSE
jgi:hypothetical protein